MRIGARVSVDYPEYFKGSLDEVRLWNIARSDTEILNNMFIELNGNENGLIGYWNFNSIENQNTFLDKCIYNHDGIIVGNVQLVNSNIF